MASFSRGSDERGFALITALLLAMAYLGLILVVLAESSLAVRGAGQRGRDPLCQLGPVCDPPADLAIEDP